MSQTKSVTSAPASGRTGARGGRRGAALLVIATAQLMVVLDATVVYVALPHIQRGLGFSSSGLEWVVNAYALTFGGLLLLGGRAGDLLGRRRMFVAGLLLFSAASLAGGFATSPAWLLDRPCRAGRRRRGRRAHRARADRDHVPRRACAQPGDGRIRLDERGGRRAWTGRGRTARHVRLLALGAVRQRADRYRRGARRAADPR